MKANCLIWILLLAAFKVIAQPVIPAQTFTNLHNFKAIFAPLYTNDAGANPSVGLVLSGNTLFGTAYNGGSSGKGTIFKVNTDGTSFTNLHSFAGTSDGAGPSASLIVSSNVLYGTTAYGGGSGKGTVFAINTNGTSFTNLYLFPNSNDGSVPQGSLILSSNTLYGTTSEGGHSGNGTVFAINTDGSGFTNLYSFTATSGSSPFTNSDGANPVGGLILSSNILYGTTTDGGSSGKGTVFKVNTDGLGFTNLYNFTAINPNIGFNNDGGDPYAGLILSGNTLYGTALVGGNAGLGTIFKVNTDGSNFMTLHSFTATHGFFATNSDGGAPNDGLIIAGNTLYGTTSLGGGSGYGTVFAVNLDGTGFTTLYNFTVTAGSYPNSTNSDGANPYGGVILSGNTLYGTANQGGNSGYGTVFSLSLPPPLLTIIPFGANVVLTWPTYAPEITLQSTTNLLSSAVWSTNLSSPVLVSGQNTVTNSVVGSQGFYRLIQSQ